MIGELSILSEWIPEQMEPGTIFVLENAGEVGETEDPYWAVLVVSDLRATGTGHAQTGRRPDAGDLRLGALLGTILHSRRADHAPQTELERHAARDARNCRPAFSAGSSCDAFPKSRTGHSAGCAFLISASSQPNPA